MKWLIIILVFVSGLIIGYQYNNQNINEVTNHYIIVKKDTTIYKPKPYAVYIKDSSLRPPCATLDTIKHYRDTIINRKDTLIFFSVVMNNHLDSLHFQMSDYQPIIRPTRWNIGITTGYGISKDGLTPFVGIGITYTLIRF